MKIGFKLIAAAGYERHRTERLSAGVQFAMRAGSGPEGARTPRQDLTDGCSYHNGSVYARCNEVGTREPGEQA